MHRQKVCHNGAGAIMTNLHLLIQISLASLKGWGIILRKEVYENTTLKYRLEVENHTNR